MKSYNGIYIPEGDSDELFPKLYHKEFAYGNFS